jgi:hypothetical protein
MVSIILYFEAPDSSVTSRPAKQGHPLRAQSSYSPGPLIAARRRQPAGQQCRGAASMAAVGMQQHRARAVPHTVCVTGCMACLPDRPKLAAGPAMVQ